MPRISRQTPLPAYRLHKPSGRAVVTIRTPDGQRRDVYLGDYNSAESKNEYARVIAERATVPLDASPAEQPTIDMVLQRFWPWANNYYRSPDGKPTSEIQSLIKAIQPLRDLYATSLAGFSCV